MIRRLACGWIALATLAQTLPAQQARSPVVPEPRPLLMRSLARNQLPTWPFRYHQGRPLDATNMVRAADIDGDGDIDLFTAPASTVPARQLLNDGRGHFIEVTASRMPSPPAVVILQFQLVDIDGDGDLDWVAGNSDSAAYQSLTIYVNDGTGRFTDESVLRGIPASQQFPYVISPSCVVEDFDGDGDNDIVQSGGYHAGRVPQSCRLLRNDGTGHFAYESAAFPVDNGIRNDEYGDLLSADIDRDGDLDLVSPGFAPGAAIWINDGTGHFTDATSTHIDPSALNYSFRTVALGDVDGDGDLDLAGTANGVLQRPLLFLNDGTGHFNNVSSSHLPPDAIGGSALHFGDFDQDGDLDLLSVIPPNSYTGYTGEQHFLVNDGTGHCELDREHLFFGRNSNGYAKEVVVADLDGDGDLDTAEASSSALPDPPEHLPYYINTFRHTWADAPPQRGVAWHLRISGPANSTAALALAFAPGNLPLPPLGRLGLDPGSLILWQQTAVIPTAREVSFDIPIPNLAQLAGAPLFVQGLLNEPTRGLRLTNTWREDAIQ